jgi:hypothetical protein
VKKLKDQGATHVTLVMDSTGVGDPIVEEVEAAGYDVMPVNFTLAKQHMVTQLSKDLEDGYARLLDKHIEEFENYTYRSRRRATSPTAPRRGSTTTWCPPRCSSIGGSPRRARRTSPPCRRRTTRTPRLTFRRRTPSHDGRG